MSWKKLKLLIWKNFLLQRRHKWQTIFEISSPVIFGLFLILIRCLIEPELKPDISYKAFNPTYFNISGRTLGNLSTVKKEGSIAFSPENPLTRKVVKKAIETLVFDNVHGFLALLFDSSMIPEPNGYANGTEMESALVLPNVMSKILCGIQFDERMNNASAWPDDVVITLRFPAIMRTPMIVHPLKASWMTNLLLPIFHPPGPRHPQDKYGGATPGYSGEMFLAIQHALSQEIIKEKTGAESTPRVYMRRLPQPSYVHDLILVAMERFVSMIIMLCFAYTFVNTVRVITTEKELQLTETMTIMGLPRWLHWLAWFIKQLSFLSISVFLMVLLIKIPIKVSNTGDKFAVMTNTPWSIIFFFMFLFVIASISFSFMVSVFFSKANTAAAFMGLAWFSTYSIFMLTQVLYESTSLTTKVILSLISNTALGFAFQMLVIGEGSLKGLQWNKMFTPVSYNDQFLPAHVALMLIIDSILYMLIAMYVEKIKPGLYGVPLPWYFPFTKSFWLPKKEKKIAGLEIEQKNALLNVVHDDEPEGIPMLVTQNLTKVFNAPKKVVDNLNLKVYKDEITVLLGHNGAGKTTTISMLTGTIPPTSGTAKINGYDIVSETELARQSLGICPQHNVLFPDLTVAEHIYFYGQLKGVQKSRINAEVDNFVKLLGLEEKRNVLSNKLSGGQKRRLSVGVAMCGDSAVVLLDEPTSGLDPASRRSLWELLQQEKKGRAMILTTHYMDEADCLGDRIAIMCGGQLQCIGTPYFLKKHYGLGYKFTIVKAKDCDVDKITNFFHEHLPDAVLNTNIGSELTYILLEAHVSKFPKLLKDFELQKEELHVESYGLSVANLEEVFMKVGAENYTANTEQKIQAENSRPFTRVAFSKTSGNGIVHPLESSNEEGTATVQQLQKVKGFKLLRNHIKAMFLKLFYNSKRSKLTNFIQFISPIINIILSVVIARSWKFLSGLPPLKLSLESGFKNTETLLSQMPNLTSVEEKAFLMYKNYFKDSRYPGMSLNDLGTSDLGHYYLKLIKSDYERVRVETLIGATFSPDNITAWFSNYGFHDSAISLATVDNAIMKAMSPRSTLTIVNHPLPYSVEHLVKVMASGNSMGFQFAFNIGFCMSFVTAFIVVFVIKERTSGARLLQRISGVRPAVMWGCAYVYDWLWLLVIHLGIIGTLACFQEVTLSKPSELGRILLVLVVFSVAITPIHYLASFYFESAATGFAKMCFVNIFCGSMPFLITEVLRLPEVGSPYYANIFDWLFSPFPIYCLSRSFRDMAVSAFSLIACDALCTQFPSIRNCSRHTICTAMNITVCCIDDEPFLDMYEPGIGRYLVIMVAVGVLSFTILLVKEYELVNKVFYTSSYQLVPLNPDEDGDVRTERKAVLELSKQELANYSLVCRDLTKYYKHFLAVNRLTFAVRKAECFGLLGINGAGKTTTFRMLTGDERISAGDATVHGYSIKTNIHDVHRHVGYCPQFDALLDNLTARETLEIFCLLRGIPVEIGLARGLELATTLGFRQHFDKRIHQCSGGTKRKISTAVALLGDASLVFLDEPTTGMDPASKRLVWRCVNNAVQDGRSLVLTTHSMEESEALCNRLTVMVNGAFRCIGPLQHLKSKFSQGYTLTVKYKFDGHTTSEDVQNVHAYILKKFPGSKLIETFHSISTYYVDNESLTWWQLFEGMEEATKLYAIEDYAVTQTTLEQVFLRFTRSS